jgi:6-phosphogluconolactonase (cycloisomerase 2 family)
MTGMKWALLGISAAALLTGCTGFWKALPTTGTGGTGTGTASGVFYVLNQKTNQVVGFSFPTGSTTPTAVTGGSANLGAAGLTMTISPNGSFLYVSTAAGIYLYTIGSGGTLTLGNNGQVISADPAFAMTVDPSNAWLLEAITGTGTLSAIPILPTTGLYDSTLQVATAALPNSNVQQVAISPSGAANPYVFVALGAGGTAVLPFTAANSNPFGNESTIAVKNSQGAANTVAVDPTNRLVYVGETVAVTGTQTGGLRAFAIGATSLTEISSTPFATGGTGPSAILPTANYVYVANKAVSGSADGNITGFTITSTAGAYSLTTVNTIGAGVGTLGLAEDSTGTYLLAVNPGGSPDLNTYTFDTTTPGKLDAGATSATGTDPVVAVAIAAVP